MIDSTNSKRIALSFYGDSLEHLDKVCKKLNLSRPQVINLLFSGEENKIDFIVTELKRVHELF